MASAGNVTVSLLLRTGSFSTDAARSAKDLEKIKKAAADTGRQIGDSFKSIATTLGIGLSVGAFAGLIKGSIDAADHLNDLSKKTGIAVDTLGGIGFAAKQAGGDLETATAAIGKLNKSIAAARAGDKSAAQGFSVLGLDELIKSGAPAEEVLASLADKFAQFEDGPEKAALAVRIFGKAGADMIPLLNDGGAALRANIEYFKRYSGVTAEVAAAADQFNDTQEKIALLSQSFGTKLAAELLPALQAVADEFLHLKENSTLFEDAAAGVRTVLETLLVLGANVSYVFRTLGKDIADSAKAFLQLQKFDYSGAIDTLRQARERGAQDRAELDSFERRVMQGPLPQAGYSNEGRNYGGKTDQTKRTAPSLPDPNAAQAELKKELDGRIRLIREFAQEQQQAYQFAQRYLDGVFDDGIISLREKFDTEKNIRDAALASQVKALDDEIAANRAAAKNLSGEARIGIESQIKEAVEKRAEAIKKAGQDDILAAQQEAKQVKALRDSYDDLRATVADLKGDSGGAAAIRNSKAIESARQLERQFASTLKTPGDVARFARAGSVADEYGDLLGKTTQLSQAQKDYNALLEHSRNQEEATLLAAQESGATEIDTLRAVGAERQKSLTQLGELATRAADLAKALNTPESIAFAEQLALAFRKAAAEVDPLLLKVRSIGQEAGQGLGDIFGNAVREGKGLKAILADIGNLISDIASKELISKPLGKAFGDLLGGTGKDGGLLGSLFGVGNGGTDSSAAATTASFTTLQTIGIDPTTSALIRFQTALDAASSMSASGGSGGSGWGSLIADIFGGSGSGGGSYNSTGGSFHDPVYDGGYSDGGYTGSGQKNEPAGVVHKGEFVNRQEVVRQPGARSFLEQFNRVGMKALAGYADGGFVAGAVSRVYSRSPALAAATSGGARQANDRPIQINLSFPPNVPRETRNQAALAIAREVRSAQKRNG